MLDPAGMGSGKEMESHMMNIVSRSLTLARWEWEATGPMTLPVVGLDNTKSTFTQEV